jgi:GxxExxY protein
MIKPREDLDESELTSEIIRGFYYVYNRLGHGFLESVYAAALERVLTRWGFKVAREVKVAIYFEGEILKYQRIDMLVNDRVIVENKAGESLHWKDPVQLTNYLCATIFEVGLLLFYGQKPKVIRRSRRNETKPLVNPDFPSVSAVSSPHEQSLCASLTEPDESTHKSSDQPPTNP